MQKNIAILAAVCQLNVLFSQQWNVDGAGDWNTAANWTPMTVPNALGATATFPATKTPGTVTITDPVTVGTISLSNMGGGYTIEASTLADTLTMNAPSNPTILTISGSHEVSAPIVIATTTTPLFFNPASGSTLFISGGISGTSGIAIQGGTMGTVAFLGMTQHTYTGSTTITSGTLQLGFEVLPMTTAVSIGSSGTLQLINDVPQTIGALSGSGGVILEMGATLTCSDDSAFTGNITGAGALGISGANTLVLSGTGNSYAGGTTIGNGATLQGTAASLQGDIENHGTLIFAQGVSGTYAGAISEGGQVVKNGVGTLTLQGTNSYTGITRIAQGGLSISSEDNLSGTAHIEIADGATLITTGSMPGTIAIPIVFDNGALAHIATNASNTTTLSGNISGTGATLIKEGTGVLALTGTNTYGGGTGVEAGTLQISNVGNLPAGTIAMGANTTLNVVTNNVALTSSHLFSLTTNENFDVATVLTIQGQISGEGSSLTKLGIGELVLSGTNNTYSGDTFLNAGTLSIAGNGSLGDTTENATLHMQDGTTLKVSTGVVVPREVMIAGTATIDTSGHSLTLSETIKGSSVVLEKTGGGTLTLSGENEYTGSTLISQGVLSVSADDNLGAASATLTIEDGATLQVGGDEGFSSSRAITLTGGGVFDVGSNDLSLQGNIGESMMGATLTKQGAGVLALTSSGNSYSGVTTIAAGTLSVSADHNLGSGSADVEMASGTTFRVTGNTFTSPRDFLLSNGNHTLDIQGTSTTLSGKMTQDAGTSSLTKSGSGKLILTNAMNDYEGTTTISGGTLSISAAGNLGVGTAAINMANGTTLQLTDTLSSAKTVAITTNAFIDVTSPAVGTLSGVISGGGLSKTGLGTLVLSGANSYLGTAVNSGVLSVSSDGNLGDVNGSIALSGGTLRTTSGFSTNRSISIQASGGVVDINGALNTTTFSGLISGVGSLEKLGAGTLVLSNASNSYGNGTRLTEGILSISSDGNLGASTGPLTFLGGTLNTTGPLILSIRPITLTSEGTIDTEMGSFAVFGGNITNSIGSIAGLTKTGPGKLGLGGTNSYAGITTVSEGILEGHALSIPGDVENDATFIFVQFGEEGTYSHAISGTGDFQKTGSFPLTFDENSSLAQSQVEVSEGTLLVNTPDFSAMAIQVFTSGTLGGTGTITGNVTVSGAMAPGASIGDTHIVGDYTQTADGTLEIEFNPSTSDRLLITGEAALDGHLRLIPLPASGYSEHIYTILIADGGRNGTEFASSSIDGSLFAYALNYTNPNEVTIEIAYRHINTDGLPPNAAAVASCLDAIQQTLPPPGSDFENVFDDLVLIIGESALIDALELLHPAALKALPYTQQTDAVLVQSLLSKRLKNFYLSRCDRPVAHRTFWADATFDYASQDKSGETVGYSTLSGAWVLGGDTLYRGDIDNPYVGAFGAITYSSVDINQPGWGGELTSLYASAYMGWKYSVFDFNASMLGFFTSYSGKREIDFTDVFDDLTVDRHAENSHHGGGFDGRLQFAYQWKRSSDSPYILRPYGMFDYIYVLESNFCERDANSLNLNVKKSTYQLVRPEVGLDFNACYGNLGEGELKGGKRGYVQASFAWAYEYELSGSSYSSQFQGESCEFQVKGIDRNRSLLIPSLTWGNFLRDGNLVISLHYEGKWTTDFDFMEQTAGIQFVY